MNILHLNFGVTKSNLSFPHYQLHRLLLANGHKSTLMAYEGDVYEPEIKILNKRDNNSPINIRRITKKLFSMISSNKQVYYYPEWNTGLVTTKKIKHELDDPPDIIIAYWTKYAFNQKIIYEISKDYDAPVLMFLYDMAHLTGGCHYSFGCENYQKLCKGCPVLYPIFGSKFSHVTWRFKNRYIEKINNVALVSMSNYLSAQAKNSSLYNGKKIYELLGIVDEEIFCPKNKELIRKDFGLDVNKKVILFGAVTLSEPRKGLDYLVNALKILKKRIEGTALSEKVHLLIAGNQVNEIDLPFSHTYLGYLNNQEVLAKAFQSADVFICPSVEDSGPMMINLSIVTGTPVVSFEMGVAANLVHNGYTGYRAKGFASEDLANGIYEILNLDSEDWDEMSKNCRQLGLKLCSKSEQYKTLMDIFNDIRGYD